MLKKTLACAAILCFSTGFIRLNGAQGADLAKGKALYEARCTLCHGPTGDGKGKGAISLKLELPDFTKKKFWEDPNIEQKTAATIKDGIKGKMRPSPDLSPEDVQSIVLYITQTFRPK
jgi:cytochrome c